MTAFVAVVLGATVVLPRVAGGGAYTILSGSMEPHLSPGDMVVVRPVAPDELGVGSVITYQLEPGQPTVVTHRVTTQGVAADGAVVLWTKGDANDAADPRPVLPVQVRGVEWYVVPYVGRVATLLDGGTRDVVTSLAVVGLFGYSALMFVGSARDRRRRPA